MGNLAPMKKYLVEMNRSFQRNVWKTCIFAFWIAIVHECV